MSLRQCLRLIISKFSSIWARQTLPLEPPVTMASLPSSTRWPPPPPRPRRLVEAVRVCSGRDILRLTTEMCAERNECGGRKSRCIR